MNELLKLSELFTREDVEIVKVTSSQKEREDKNLECSPDCNPNCSPECNPECNPNCVPSCNPQCSPNCSPCYPYGKCDPELFRR